MSLDFALTLLVSTAVFVVAAAFLTPRRWDAPLNDWPAAEKSWLWHWRRQSLWLKLSVAAPLAAVVFLGYEVLRHREMFWLAFLGAIGAFVLLVVAFRSPVAEGTHAQINYQFNPDRCGACGYDWSAAPVAGPRRCPECGWIEPAVVPRIEPPDWWVPWRHGWRIAYLHDPRFTLRQAGHQLAVSTGLTVIMVALMLAFGRMAEVVAPSIGIGLAGMLMSGSNLARVALFLRRQAPPRPGE